MLCSNCADLDLAAVFQPKSAEQLGSARGKADNLWCGTEDVDPTCTFCLFMLDCHFLRTEGRLSEGRLTKVSRTKPGRINPRTLSTLSDPPTLNIIDAGSDFTLLRISAPPVYGQNDWNVVFGLSASKEPQSPGNRPDGRLALVPPLDPTLSRIRDCLEECRRSHNICASLSKRDQAVLSNLRVIDCFALSIVPAPEACQFVALSYVWGSTPRRCERRHGNTLERIIPQTIKDAIAVTKVLGFKYLWVDAYCVMQIDPDLHHQLRQMDLIYRAAEVTIIAAAGKDPTFGLPGISRQRRPRQAEGTFKDISLTTVTGPNAWLRVHESIWNSRGWTMQESLFSRRRLFFTEFEMLYDCSVGWGCEDFDGFHDNPGNIHVQGHNYYRPDFWLPKMPISRIYSIVGSYNGKQLTYEEDVLNAFAGVLRKCETLEPPVKSHWGTLLPLGDDRSMEKFIFGLTWTSTIEPVNRKRRNGFPSWSWTGWISPVYWSEVYKRDQYVHSIQIPEGTNVEVELQHGSLLDWRRFEKMLNAQPSNLTFFAPYITLRGFATPARLDGNDLVTMGNVSFKEPVGCDLELHEYGFDGKEKKSLDCMVIVLHRPMKDHMYRLLLVSKNGCHWERIGQVYIGYKPVDEQPRDNTYFLTFQPNSKGEKFRVQFELTEFRLG